jgi:hypothetical protein
VAGKKGAKRRTKAQCEAVREAAREELAAHHPMTLRQIHYRLVSRDDVVQPNTISAYDKLGGWLRDDRLADLIPWEWMEDRLRVATSWRKWDDPEEFVDEYLGEMASDYRRNPWQDQPRYVEVWCEKDALSGIFRGVVGGYFVTLNIGRGYDSWTAIHRAAKRFLRREEWEEKQTAVLYFGDFDPSGEDMHRSLIARFGMLGAYPEVPKIALTHEDARVLPGDVTKADDSRAPAFVAKYGDLAVELDALPVEDLQGRIRRAIEDHLDMGAFLRSRNIQEDEREDIREYVSRLPRYQDDGLAD